MRSMFVQEDPLVVLRDSDDGDKRVRALQALQEPRANGGSQEEQDVVMKLLAKTATEDHRPICRLSAIQALGQFKDPRAVDALSNAYYQATSFPPNMATVVQMAALEALGETKNPNAVPLLTRVVREPAPALTVPVQEKLHARDRRAAAARALANFKDVKATQALVHVLKEEKEVTLRKCAHESLQTATGKSLPADAEKWQKAIHNVPVEEEPSNPVIQLMSWMNLN